MTFILYLMDPDIGVVSGKSGNIFRRTSIGIMHDYDPLPAYITHSIKHGISRPFKYTGVLIIKRSNNGKHYIRVIFFC